MRRRCVAAVFDLESAGTVDLRASSQTHALGLVLDPGLMRAD